MKTPVIKPEWRTATVVELCLSMRECQDFTALPILADALQDANCDDEQLLSELRECRPGYSRNSALVACVMSEKTADAVQWLANFADAHDCPEYETLIAAATGNHKENYVENDYYSELADWGEKYLHFNGSDAHGPIPPEFWNYVELATGVKLDQADRAERFSCSC
jgi:hypothetical protein